MHTLFTILITLQFLVVVLHDWIDIAGWTHGRQVQAGIGRGKLGIATVINAVFPGLAAGMAIWYWNAPKPAGVTNYWVIYCAVTLLSAMVMWYVPYLFGAPEKTRRAYQQMYAGTRQILPPRGENPRPNLLHVCFHVLFVVTLLLAIGMRWGG